jgi:hypothetical protein
MIASPYLSGTKMGRMLSFIRAYKRRIVSSLVFVYAAFLLIHPDEEGRASDLIWFALLVMLIASQFFWIRRVVDVGERFLPGKLRRTWLVAIVGAIWLILSHGQHSSGISSQSIRISCRGNRLPFNSSGFEGKKNSLSTFRSASIRGSTSTWKSRS